MSSKIRNFSLFGYESVNFDEVNRYNNANINDLKFPIEAYRAMCDSLDLPFPLMLTNPKSQALPKVDQELEVVEGVTVTDLQKMCKRSAAFHSVLKAVAMWQHIEKENTERMTEEALRVSLRRAARKDKWGSDNGELAKNTQETPIVKLILGDMRAGGRPKK